MRRSPKAEGWPWTGWRASGYLGIEVYTYVSPLLITCIKGSNSEVDSNIAFTMYLAIYRTEVPRDMVLGTRYGVCGGPGVGSIWEP